MTDFALDSLDELAKIVQETVPLGLVGDPPALGLFVRLALPKGGAVYDLSGKFGASPEEAAALLRAARPHAARLGITFHVGSQCLDPAAYARAMALAAQVIAAAVSRSRSSMSAAAFRSAIPTWRRRRSPTSSLRSSALQRHCPPVYGYGPSPAARSVAGGGSVVVQVQLRRGDALYVNDGVYGNLSDAGALGFRFPARRIRAGEADGGESEPRRFHRCSARPATAPTG